MYRTRRRAVYRPRWAPDCETCSSRGIDSTEFTPTRCILLNDPRFPEIEPAALAMIERPRCCYFLTDTEPYVGVIPPGGSTVTLIPHMDNRNWLYYPDQCDTLRSPLCWRRSPLIITSVEQFIRAHGFLDGVRFCEFCNQYYQCGE